MVYSVDEIKEKLTPIFEEKGVLRAFLFGSYAKGQATAESDIDIVAHVDEDMGILDFCEIADDVINALGKEVDFLYGDDVISGGKIDLELKKDGVLIYDKV